MAGAACGGRGIPTDDVAELLASLVAKSLVAADTRRARARYRVLETIRAYGRDRLDEAGETAAIRERYASWCVEQAERGWNQMVRGAGQPLTHELEAELDNLRAALEWTVASQPNMGLRLASALTPFWAARGYFTEGQEWLTRALDAGAREGMRARALCCLGSLAIMRGEVEVARGAVEESLALAREVGPRRGEVEALNLLAFISIFTQDPLAAKPLVEESIALARLEGDPASLASALALYGRARLFLGDVRGARRVFDECLDR